MGCRHLAITFLLVTLSLAATLAHAQDNYKIQVYGSDLVDPGHTMVELHSNFTIDGSKTIVDGAYPPVMRSMRRGSIRSPNRFASLMKYLKAIIPSGSRATGTHYYYVRGAPLMKPILQFLRGPTEARRSIVLVRIAVGLIFLTQGILKYLDPNMGVGRFTKIGFPHPYFTAHFLGTFEILCGFLLLIGLWTRLASIPLFVVITTAIATTKIPELFRANQGFWYMVSDARTDFAMFCCLIFLTSVGGGLWSIDAKLAGPDRSRE